MPSDYDNNLLRQGIIHAKANEIEAARRYLERAVEAADDRETRVQANFWMAQITADPLQKRGYLEEVLANDMTHPEARRALAILDGKIKPDDIVDPDNLPAQPTATQAAKADRFTCPKCGGRMTFTPDGRSLMCEYCSRNQTLDTTVPEIEQDFILAMATGKGHRKPVAVKTFHCQGCGAQFVLPPQEITSTCSYCGSSHVVIGTKELVEPDSIIPMGFNQRQAALYLVEWVKKHKITPEGQVQAPRGLYLPIWTFDIMGNVPWNGMVYRDKQYVPVSGEKLVHFDDIVIPGAPKLADLLPRIMEGFDTTMAPAYDSRYLAGWPAEVYATAMSDASLNARQLAVRRTRELIRGEMGHVSDLNYSTSSLAILSFKLVLVPVWITSIPLEGRDYRVIINGMMGNVYGETPSRGVLGFINNILGT
jgi:Zn finger protein HypA/HybF involved in hydrogenase expression